MLLNVLMILFAGLLFIVSAAAHIYVQVRPRPREDSDLDDYYHEFEGQHPGLARYERWFRITLTGAVIAMLLLFLAAIL